MLFDFQGGADEWPDNVTLVDSQKAEELIDAAKKTIEKKSMEKKKEEIKKMDEMLEKYAVLPCVAVALAIC